MIVICDKAQNVIVPAGLGDNPGVVYETSGVKSLNGETGDLKIKTVNGNDMLGEGNIEIKGGVETVNGETGDVKIKTVNGQSLMGEGDVPVDVGVETLNGQKGALTLKTVNGNELTGDGNIEIQAGLKYFELSEASRKEAYDEIANHWDDNSGYTGDCIFYYRRERGVYTFSEIGYLKDHSVWFNYLNNAGTYGIGDGKVKCFAIIIWYENGKPSWSTYEDDRTIPTKVSELTNDSEFQTKAEVDTAIENAVSGGGGATNALTYKQITNENRQEVYDDVKAHWSDVSGYTGNYVYFYQKGKDQIIFDEVKFENNNAYFNSATVTFTSGQVHNPGVRLLCSIVPSEGDVQIAEKYTTISSIDGMQYRARGEANGNAAIFFDTNNYGNGYGIYSTVNTGEENGLFGARFRDGIDGYKGNTPANIFTDGTDVFMAFDVVDYHYVYKVQADGAWAFVSKTKIGGVQSSEVSNIKVLTQSQYDTLTTKDENVLYCIKG